MTTWTGPKAEFACTKSWETWSSYSTSAFQEQMRSRPYSANRGSRGVGFVLYCADTLAPCSAMMTLTLRIHRHLKGWETDWDIGEWWQARFPRLHLQNLRPQLLPKEKNENGGWPVMRTWTLERPRSISFSGSEVDRVERDKRFGLVGDKSRVIKL